MTLPAFVLYGLFGCPSCAEAEKYLRKIGVPAALMISNEDPIIDAGVVKLTGESRYPVLLYRPTKEVIAGFKPEEYERVARHFYSISSASIPSAFDSQQQSQP